MKCIKRMYPNNIIKEGMECSGVPSGCRMSISIKSIFCNFHRPRDSCTVFTRCIPYLFEETTRFPLCSGNKRHLHLTAIEFADYYKTLGIDRNASQQEIKSAYYKLVKKYHPDTSTIKNTDSMFKQVQQAYEILSDPSRRSSYDSGGSSQQSRTSSSSGRSTSNTSSSHYTSNTQSQNFTAQDWMNWSKSYKQGKNYEDANRNYSQTVFNRQNQRENEDFREDDFFSGFFKEFGFWKYSPFVVKSTLRISLAESYSGVRKVIRLPVEGICPTCNGSGANIKSKDLTCSKCAGMGYRVINSSPAIAVTCSACDGSGQVYAEACNNCSGSGRSMDGRDVIVEVPKGSYDGETLTYISGMQTVRLTVKVDSDLKFKRVGDNLVCTVEVDMLTLINGGKVPVVLIDGSVVMLNIPKNSETTREFILRNKGFQRDPIGCGDAVFNIKIIMSENLKEKIAESLKNQKTSYSRGDTTDNRQSEAKIQESKYSKRIIASVALVLAVTFISLLLRYA